MFNGNFKLAWDSVRQAKFRSFLTMLGIIIGVASVVTTISLGEGLKQQIAGQINHLGEDLITIRPGNVVRRDTEGNVISYNLTTSFGTGSLSEQDFTGVKNTRHVRTAVPLDVITGVGEAQGRTFDSGVIFGTTEGIPDILNQKVEHGEFFGASDSGRYVAVIGRRVAEQLFQEYNPIGKTVRIRNNDFIVKGVFEEFRESSFLTGTDYNAAIFIPFNIGKQISDGNTHIVQVLAKPDKPDNIDEIVNSINAKITENHAGQKDFTVLKQAENLAAVGHVLNIITGFIAGIAAISLIVGGIGIMNIMLFTISERTWEIGLRKSIGATNRQIRNQFMTESIVLSVLGGVIGILISLAINGILRTATTIEPVTTLPVIGIAAGVSVVVGIVFGTFPAIKAARLDPIEALRRG